MLREYQQEAHDISMSWARKNIDPALIEAATGAGKSHVIAAIAESFYNLSGKNVLCTAPSAELVSQNHAKFLATGNEASIFSASLGIKSLRHPVVFGTPGTIKNNIAKFGDKFGLIVIDECDGITPTIEHIIDSIRFKNNKLRVIGLTATPYRLKSGLIYAMDEDDKPSREEECASPYFVKKIFTIQARKLINEGYLTAPIIGSIHGDHYDTKNLKINGMGKFFPADIDRAFVGNERKTSRIVHDIVDQSQYRRGVMIFAATVKHAEEIMASLPPQLSRMIGGNINTGTQDRKRLVQDFKDKKYKYLVSVGTMTTGVDFTHVDVIAFMRATESIRLMQQIAGRGSRVEYAPGMPLDTIDQRLAAIAAGTKKDFLILDYAENFERHCPDGDLYNPQIKAQVGKKSSTIIVAKCELCNVENEFSARPNYECFGIDEHGYFVDLNKIRIKTDYGDMPAHYGRRCMALHRQDDGKFEQCDYYWTSKKCPDENCNELNDIAARYCRVCKTEIIDPNEKLIDDFKARKKDPYRTQCDKVLSWSFKKTLSGAGNEVLKVDFITEHRSFAIWYQIRSAKTWLIKQYEALLNATGGLVEMPETITYRKQLSGFYEALAYNQEADKREELKLWQ